MPDGPGRGLARRHHALTVWRAGARSTEAVSFGVRSYSWADVPREVQREVRHRSPVVAEQAGTDGTLRERAGAVVEVLRAWRAHHDRLFVVVVERPVRVDVVPRQPVGPWSAVWVAAFDAAAPIRRRVGLVPAGVAPVPTAGGGDGGPPPPAAPPEAAGAANAWPYLPAAVRDGAVKAVPLPEDWLGHLVQRTDSAGLPASQEVVMLRRDAARAVVVRAGRGPVAAGGPDERTRTLARTPWVVEQFDLDLRPVRQLAATRDRAPWE